MLFLRCHFCGVFHLVSSIDPLAACGYSGYVLWALDSARQRTYVQAMTGAGQDVASVGIVWAMLLYAMGTLQRCALA